MLAIAGDLFPLQLGCETSDIEANGFAFCVVPYWSEFVILWQSFSYIFSFRGDHEMYITENRIELHVFLKLSSSEAQQTKSFS